MSTSMLEGNMCAYVCVCVYGLKRLLGHSSYMGHMYEECPVGGAVLLGPRIGDE